MAFVAIARTFLLFLVLFFMEAYCSIDGNILENDRLPSSKMCRGEFDCRDPEECIDGYCKQGVQCRWPGRLDYGYVSPRKNLYSIGQTVTYACQPGYIMRGEKVSTCQSKGHWSSNKPQCVAIGCTNPGRPFRGFMEPEKDWYNVGEIVRYYCKENYQVVGTGFTQCRQDGSWIDQVPICVRPPRPTRVPPWGLLQNGQ